MLISIAKKLYIYYKYNINRINKNKKILKSPLNITFFITILSSPFILILLN